ncbi:MAG: hypothetical protein NZ699_05215 [Roseiflexus sp.]|nr:hypothetical protein [Roseiflexus sp.]MCS7288515.1 hypothetical protein [Roseiflexus sp.]MDW8147423.1 hypothetical protein [Roseiflexaceae bacterium]MDW8231328.1 hypothetical protein [Roseiflexaceae bacterium]
MSVEKPSTTSSDETQIIVEEQLYCSLTGRPISRDEAYWAPPFITARQLVTTIISTAIHAPHQLGYILFAEQPNVPYAKDVREQLARRRSAEQLKLLIGLLAVLGVLLLIVFLLVLR